MTSTQSGFKYVTGPKGLDRLITIKNDRIITMIRHELVLRDNRHGTSERERALANIIIFTGELSSNVEPTSGILPSAYFIVSYNLHILKCTNSWYSIEKPPTFSFNLLHKHDVTVIMPKIILRLHYVIHNTFINDLQ